ncbi:hypothetical protein NXT08_14055 [Rhodococcus pyridinivorans]|uniref:Uncharacterized protein n=2 Tax=Rhodococcus TaxID=1827 RepID=A0A7T7LHH2_9NOCA|nr:MULTISPECIES: hypothetical protein [Rhodococcus]MBX4168764.1 hypothetical protein [Rhodococcus sp. DMU2021]MCD2117880.1 hypothetical protein [Rhodococcus pyridinivorans]MCD5419622.1 hypothetical protein [Rhodococcus pyridinivorans]MCT7293521.1 hypothetical protein [Rhodococcus sp. PAE-6]MCW3468970.1 hypothetical protein [Rhodococcus pyridinivorans]
MPVRFLVEFAPGSDPHDLIVASSAAHIVDRLPSVGIADRLFVEQCRGRGVMRRENSWR